jgi:ATP-dependent Lhr-like helicase
VYADATTLVQRPNGEIQWWTFAGGIANTLLADTLKSHCDVTSDNLSLSFPTASSLDVVAALIDGLQPTTVRAIPNREAMENLKFSECLSPDIAAEVFTARFDDPDGVAETLSQPRRILLEN